MAVLVWQGQIIVYMNRRKFSYLLASAWHRTQINTSSIVRSRTFGKRSRPLLPKVRGFYAYPSDLPPERLNAQLRRGLAPPPSRRAVEITAVQGVPPTGWRNDECGEWLGALGAAVGSEVAAPREGVLRGQRGVREEEEEEWVKA